MGIRDVALPVPRGGKFTPEAIAAFEEFHPHIPAGEQNGARHARRAASDNGNFHHILMISQRKSFVNVLTRANFRGTIE